MKEYKYNCKKEADLIKKFYPVGEDFLDNKVTEIAVRNMFSNMAEDVIEHMKLNKKIRFDVEMAFKGDHLYCDVKSQG